MSDFVEELAKHMRVTVLAPGPEASVETVGAVSIRRFTGPRTALSLLHPTNPMHWYRIFSILQNGRRTAEALARQYKFDHTVALWALPSGYWAHRLERLYNVPYSIWALGSDIWSLGKIPFVRSTLRMVLRGSAVCFADGHLLRQDVEHLCGRACDFLPSVRQLPILGKKQLRDGPPYRLAYLGRWHSNKGVDLLLESLALLDDEDWNKIETLSIHGGGPLETLVRARANALIELGRPVRIGGYLDKQGAANLLTLADYVIIPSRIESIPVIFSDAMQASCPIIATPVGDLPRLLQEYDVGVLAESVDPRSIFSAIRCALSRSPAGYENNLARARKRFSLSATCEQFLDAVRSRSTQ